MPTTQKDNRFARWVRKYSYYLFSILELLTQFSPITQIIGLFTGLAGKGTRLVALRQWRLRFEVRSAMDIWSVKETFIDRFYEKYGCPVGEGWIVLDIGGGIGDFSIFAAYHHPSNQIYAFEPYPGSFSLLVGNVQSNEIANVTAFQQAIWASSGRLALDTSTGEPVQFISREIGGVGGAGKVMVQCTSLEETLDQLAIDHCDLLKIDAEGAEYAILFNASDATLEKIQRIVMEYHDAITQHTHVDMVIFLQGKGYRVTAVPNVVHSELGYLYAQR